MLQIVKQNGDVLTVLDICHLECLLLVIRAFCGKLFASTYKNTYVYFPEDIGANLMYIYLRFQYENVGIDRQPSRGIK